MPWLDYSVDEVSGFHPEFESAANEALKFAGLNELYEWVHHLRTQGNALIPDFVFRNKRTHQWILAFEIKRTRDAVYSMRYQLQAKGYAESNGHLYPPTAPKYFAISNLEDTVLFAINGDKPPLECRIANGVYASGRFLSGTATSHKQNFIHHLTEICRVVVSNNNPSFDIVWPGILSDFKSYSTTISNYRGILLSEPDTFCWDIIRNYFGSSLSKDSVRIFFFRCLMVEYLRGILLKYEHPKAKDVPPLQLSSDTRLKTSIANTIDVLRTIDFKRIFEDSASDQYRQLNDPQLIHLLTEYITGITSPPRRMVDLVLTRVDYPELLESILDLIYPMSIQDDSGKAQTDFELAEILSTVTINDANSKIIDPCCGDGILLSTAYNRLRKLGCNSNQVLSQILGIEVDAIATKVAYLRIALKEPASLSPLQSVLIEQGDMFAQTEAIMSCNTVLMNPPFKRYEIQDKRPIPNAIKQYYSDVIHDLDGVAPEITGSQANLFNYYIEYVTKAIKPNTRVGIILDNKWYHNQYGASLRRFLLDFYDIEAIIEYPHSIFFSGLTIATSILVATRVSSKNPKNEVRFVRAKSDPRGTDLGLLSQAFHNDGVWPIDWTCRKKVQSELDHNVGWKRYFLNELCCNYTVSLTNLSDLFKHSRRGSLNKEEGGVGVFELPFGLSNFGNKREAARSANPRPFQTYKGKPLTPAENQILRNCASRIPEEFRGYAVRNADDINHYTLSEADVTKEQTIEPPILKFNQSFNQGRRVQWSCDQEQALVELNNNTQTKDYIEAISSIIGLNDTILPSNALWVGLREPYAGEIIIPRKMRTGHRVHVNPFCFDTQNRQMRISSNFITYKECIAIDTDSNLDRECASKLIAAFLISSFGQLQFEVEGINREGCLAIEKSQLDFIKVIDPRLISKKRRPDILEAFNVLPYPILTDRLSPAQCERNYLDKLFAQELSDIYGFNANVLLSEVHTLLDEWLVGRQP